MNCKYCYQRNKGSEDMSMHIVVDSMNYLLNQSSRNLEVFLWGGEPLLRRGAIEYCVKNYPSVQFRMGTNGTLVDDSFVEFCNKHRDNLGVYVSHDGLEQRPNRSMEISDKALEIASIKNNFVHIVSTDPSTIVDSVELLYDRGVRRFKISLANGLRYSEDQLFEYRKSLSKLVLWARLDYFKPENDKSKIEFKTWNQILDNHFLGIETENYDCNVGSSTIAISPDGSIYPCDWYYDLKLDRLGNIYSGIDEIVRKKFIGLKCGECMAEKISNGGDPSTSSIASKIEKEVVIACGTKDPEMRTI